MQMGGTSVSDATPAEEVRRKILDLPDDWWQTVSASQALMGWFKGHVVGLLVAGSTNSQFQYSFYTGFLLAHMQQVLWLTAGHVVEELQAILSSASFRVTQFCWLDNYDDPAAPVVPVHRRDMLMQSWRSSRLDFGAAVPSLLDTGNLLHNEKVHLMEETIWRNLKQASPEGYYAIGYPRPWTTHNEKPAQHSKVLHSLEANLACLPLRELPAPVEVVDDPSWSDPEAFYGEILPYTDLPAFEVDDIKGMSGGPVLSVERTTEGRVAYRLVGIVHSWFRPKGLIRAEPIHKIAEALNAWLA